MTLKHDWNVLVEDESIFMHDSCHDKKKKMDSQRKKDQWLQSPAPTAKPSSLVYYPEVVNNCSGSMRDLTASLS